MNYRLFVVIASVIGVISLSDIAIYNYFNYIGQSPITQFWTKLAPLLLYLILTVIYMSFYGFDSYNAFTANGLFLCWLGDLFLALYSPQTAESRKYFYTGGVCFFLSRINWTGMLFVYPEKNFKLTRYSYPNLIIALITTTIFTTGFGVYFYLNTSDHLLGALVLLYYILGMAPLLALSYLRIGKISTELFSGTALAFAGFLLFSVSDTILFFSLITPVIPISWSFLSNNIYWISMYLIAISVARRDLKFTSYNYLGDTSII